MFKDLYLTMDRENGTYDRLSCDVQMIGEDINFVIEFLQRKGSNNTKWNKPGVLTDAKVTLYYLPKIFSSLTSKTGLLNFIGLNYQSIPEVMAQLDEVCLNKHEIEILLPTSIYPTSDGLPTNIRPMKDTFRPLIVTIDGNDVSVAFEEFDKYEEKAATRAYQALIPKLTTKIDSKNISLEDVMALIEEDNSEAEK